MGPLFIAVAEARLCRPLALLADGKKKEEKNRVAKKIAAAENAEAHLAVQKRELERQERCVWTLSSSCVS